MKKLLAVLKVLGQWLLGAIAFALFAWCFLAFLLDDIEPTAQVVRNVTLWSIELAIPLGYPTFMSLEWLVGGAQPKIVIPGKDVSGEFQAHVRAHCARSGPTDSTPKR